MKQNKLIGAIVLLGIITIVFFFYKNNNVQKLSAIDYKDYQEDSSVKSISAFANYSKVYDDIKQLKEKADIIIEGEVLDHQYFDFMTLTYTKSRVRVTKAYTQNVKEGEIINIAELGGITTQDKINEYNNIEEKFGKLSDDEKEKAKTKKVKTLFDNLPCMNQGEKVVVFACSGKKFFNDDLYYLVGETQGKFLVKEDGLERVIPNELKSDKVLLKTTRPNLEEILK